MPPYKTVRIGEAADNHLCGHRCGFAGCPVFTVGLVVAIGRGGLPAGPVFRVICPEAFLHTDP